MKPEAAPDGPELAQVQRVAQNHAGIRTEVRSVQGADRTLTEVYLFGHTANVPTEVTD